MKIEEAVTYATQFFLDATALLIVVVGSRGQASVALVPTVLLFR